MQNSIAVANYFIKKSLNDGTEVTPMKLVKLVYIAHGWHLALNNGEPLLPEAVEAWKYGPVVPKIYHTFKKYGGSRITSLESQDNEFPNITDPGLVTFLDKVWEIYKNYSGFQLSTLTHQPDTPWDIIWNRENGKSEKIAPIRNLLIEEHYKALAQKRA
jgi:uncharacterized phage-associated protein